MSRCVTVSSWRPSVIASLMNHFIPHLAVVSAALVTTACSSSARVAPISDAPIVRVQPPTSPDLSIAGQVVDDRGGPVPDVYVRAGAVEVLTDGGGRFRLVAPRAGRYELGVLEVVDGWTAGVVAARPASLQVNVPSPDAHYVQLVVRRVGAIAWPRPGVRTPRDVAQDASVSLARGTP